MSEFRCAVKNLLLACAVMVGLLISLPAFAAGGACIWEGGVGAQDTNSDGEYDVNASCWLEDCDGNGGIADCKAPRQGYRPKIIPSETDSEGWKHNVCLADQGGVTASVAFCEGNGGDWMGGNPSYCDDSNFPEGITWIGGITEANVNQAADNYIDNRFGACSTLTSDSGWGTNSSSQCYGNSNPQLAYLMESLSGIGNFAVTTSVLPVQTGLCIYYEPGRQRRSNFANLENSD